MCFNKKGIEPRITIQESYNSPILMAKRELFFSNKRIQILNQMTEDEIGSVKKLDIMGV